MNIFLSLLGLVLLYGFVTFVVAIHNSPEGFQDEEGFHALNKNKGQKPVGTLANCEGTTVFTKLRKPARAA